MKIDPIASLNSVVRMALAKESVPTQERIRELINIYRKIPDFVVSDTAAENLAREIESYLDISMNSGFVVQEEFKEWLNAAKQGIDPYYWDRYHRLLEQKGFPRQVKTKLDEVTDRVLGLLENPKKDGPWDRRGMVVGHVQSGKTANYIGLICKAADAGYRLIIVIAGIYNNLRNQTQERIDEGFVGKDSSRLQSGKSKRYIGVGKYDAREFPLTVTNSARDFNKQAAETLGVELRALNVPAVLVIKKNTNTLKNVINWLKEHNASGNSQIVDAPMLLIDDEADNASIDISQSPEEASRINSQIRELLKLFNRKCYVGYTATPFANIFIDPETEQDMIGADLFPRDFIYKLDTPSNYFGAMDIFGESSDMQVIRHITDNGDLLPIRHKNGHQIPELPNSLKTAIRTFILAKTIRLLRGQNRSHNSMLVNASRFTSVQGELRNLIHEFLENIKRRVRFESAQRPSSDALKDDEIKTLFDIWEKEYGELEYAWEDIQPLLHESIAPINVVEVNSRSSGTLNYTDHQEHGLSVIAVGGFSLSRGLTIEGLTISYFLRNSMMYDTLMQMGRWFGYRPNYEDVCRIWMTPEAEGWYSHITESIEELGEEIRKMDQAKLTPKDFGLKVRSHPDSLIVTARNKMRSAEQVPVKIGLANHFIETAILWRKKEQIEANRMSARRLVDRIKEIVSFDPKMPTGNYLWRDVPVDPIVEFIGAFRNHDRSVQTYGKPVQEYIRRRAGDELAKWDVVLISRKSDTSDTIKNSILGLDITCQNRSAGRQSEEDFFIVTDKQRVADSKMEAIGLSDEKRMLAEKEYREKLNKSGVSYPGRIYRGVRDKPLLILHLLRMMSPKGNSDKPQKQLCENSVVAWSISFGCSDYKEDTVEYVVNTTWWQENFSLDFDEEDISDNDIE